MKSAKYKYYEKLVGFVLTYNGIIVII